MRIQIKEKIKHASKCSTNPSLFRSLLPRLHTLADGYLWGITWRAFNTYRCSPSVAHYPTWQTTQPVAFATFIFPAPLFTSVVSPHPVPDPGVTGFCFLCDTVGEKATDLGQLWRLGNGQRSWRRWSRLGHQAPVSAPWRRWWTWSAMVSRANTTCDHTVLFVKDLISHGESRTHNLWLHKLIS